MDVIFLLNIWSIRSMVGHYPVTVRKTDRNRYGPPKKRSLTLWEK
jgi:hypothetical protein